MKHSVEQLALLQQYIIGFTIILGLPGISLFINKDKRFKIALFIYFFLIIIFIFLYISGNKIFFPDITVTADKD